MSNSSARDNDGEHEAPATTQMSFPPAAGEGAAPATTEFGLGIDDPTHISMRLPPILEEIFEPIREFASGGQATLLLCRRRDDPTQEVAIKLYHREVGAMKVDPRENFRSLSPEHVVTYVEPYFGTYNRKWWEVQEYMAEGNLRELVRSQGGALNATQIAQLLHRMTDALDELHSQEPRIIHRDIKPENLLVRTRDPLHVVLADFGLAVLNDKSNQQFSGSRTDAYAAPEAPSGDAHPPLDWWSLGMTIAELAAGKHPYTLDDGRFMNERAISSAIATRPVPLEGITDDRLLLLLRGLLTRDPRHRWRADEVRAWLEGKSPAVAADETVVTPTTSPSTQARQIEPFPMLRRDFTDPDELGAAIASDWARASSLLVGHYLTDLVKWVESNFPERSIKALVDEYGKLRQVTERDVNVLIARLVITLNPTGPAVFMGEQIDMVSLGDWAARINTESGRHLRDIVEWFFDAKLLRDYRKLPGLGELAWVDETWKDLSDAADNWFRQVPEAGATMTPEIRALILRVAVARVAGVAA